MDGNPPRSRWWQRISVRPSVRVLMVFVLISGAGLGYYVHWVQVQRDAVAAIERAGGKVFYGWQLWRVRTPDLDDLTPNPAGRPRWPRWIVDHVGPDYYSSARYVIIFGPADPIMAQVGQLRELEEIDFLPGRKVPGYGPSNVGMAHLRGLTELKHLKLGISTGRGVIGSKITGAGLAAISGATKLQILQLQGIPLADPDLGALRGMTDLRDLDLQGTRVTAAGIAHLRGMTRLKRLNLALTGVESLETCRPLASLINLTLARTPLRDAGLAPASDPGLAGLTILNLFNTRISDDGLKSLRDLPKLKRLELTGTDVTDAGIAEFKKNRPKISVGRRPSPSKSPPVPAGG